ncbi:wax ester/triacylglycerol synthase domain-containing protein [Variovorax sp. dw_954]|uniref:wax ester/triacylglycerol synthase domain-containing protein n=1 Tax=Variovorax sp. dw_954 TaxID=2720078 RepID=UPI001BD2774E|nr:wax ester/triacylglycerol synthase domain-containing protein [Variovorax sp. dw_954]
MPALSVIDLAMFLLETPERPFNIGPLVVLEPPARGRAGFADRLMARMLERPAGAPFNYKLRTPPLAMPTLEVDAEADVSKQVHRVTLEGAGSLEDLCAEVCRLHESRLDLTRLLWEMYIIDGIEGGKVALYGKTHHGIIDGRGFVQAISHWLAESPHDLEVRAMWDALPRHAQPNPVRASVARRLTGLLDKLGGTAMTAVELSGMLAQQGLKALGVGGAKGLSLPYTGVPGALRGRASARRSLAFTTLPIAGIKAIGKATGSTLNDVLLATLDMALARYLHERGKRASKPLVAAMPIALAHAQGGNQIAVLQFPLGAPGLGPAQRLAAIRAETRTVKNVIGKSGSEAVMLYTTLVHGIPALVEKIGLKTGVPVANLMVSNPFGFAEKRFLMGAKVAWVLPVSVVPAGQMLNVTTVTLDERLQVGFLAMPEAVPGVEMLARHAAEAFEELKGAVLGEEAAAQVATVAAKAPAARARTARKAAGSPAPARPAASANRKSATARRSA